MVYEQEKLVRRVLSALGVLDANDAPSPEDAQLVGEAYAQKAEELFEEGLLPFDIEGDIPGRYFISLVWIVAECLVLDYGRGQRTPKLEQNAARGIRQLWRLRQPAYVHTPTRATYY